MKKFIALFLSSVIFLFSFSVFAFAGDGTPENLINPDLRTWEKFQGSLSDFSVILLGDSQKYSGHDIYRMTVTGSKINEDSNVCLVFGDLNTGVELVAGNSYSFSFYLPDYRDMNLWITRGKSAGSSSSYYGTDNSKLKSSLIIKYNDPEKSDLYVDFYVGVVFGDVGADDTYYDDSIGYAHITYDNFDDFAGKTTKISFVCPDYKGNPRLVIVALGTHSIYGVEFHISDLAFYDNNQITAELKGIKGLLHNLYWDLFGGVCDEEDCPHSSEDNPHEDLLTRLFVPDEAFLSDFKDNITDLFASKLGFIGSCINFVLDVLNKLQDLFTADLSDVFSFTLPALSFDFLGYHISLWDDITISMDWLQGTTGIGLLYTVYKSCLHVGFILGLVAYGDRIYKDVLNSS